MQMEEHHLARSFDLSFRHIDDVISLNNPSFEDFIHRIYSAEIKLKDTTDKMKPALRLDLHIEIDGKGRLMTKLYDKRDDCSFSSQVSFYFISLASVYEAPKSCQSLLLLGRLYVPCSNSYNKASKTGLCCYNLKSSLQNFEVLWSSWNRGSLLCIHLHHDNRLFTVS